MAAQMNYNYGTPKGVPGGKFDIAFDEVITRQNEEADGILKYGMAAMVGTNAGHTVKVPVAGTTADKIEGIVLHAANTEQDMKGKVNVAKGASVGIVTKGKVWGRLADADAPTYGAKAYVVISGDDAGCFTATADTTTNTTVDIGATFGNASDTGIAVIVLK